MYEILLAGFEAEAEGSSARDFISLFQTNHIQPSKFVSME